MKKIVCFLLLSLIAILNMRAQEIVEYKGDTLIVISPGDLKTMNHIITDLEYSTELIGIQERIIAEDSIIKLRKDSTINYYIDIQNKKDDYYLSTVENLENSLKKEKKKRKITTYILGSVAVVLGYLAIK